LARYQLTAANPVKKRLPAYEYVFVVQGPDGQFRHEPFTPSPDTGSVQIQAAP
jgi:hypothetical protein